MYVCMCVYIYIYIYIHMYIYTPFVLSQSASRRFSAVSPPHPLLRDGAADALQRGRVHADLAVFIVVVCYTIVYANNSISSSSSSSMLTVVCSVRSLP